jgi:hypothetical protein
MISVDEIFYKKVYQANKHELFEISKDVAHTKNINKINSYISCLYASKEHRKTITKTVLRYLKHKAVPILKNNLELLDGKEKIYQLLLLLQLGYKEYFYLMIKEYIKFSNINKDLNKYIEEYLTNNIDKYKNEITIIFDHNETSAILFIAPWIIKLHHDLTINYLCDLLNDSEGESNNYDKAIILLSTHEPLLAFDIIENQSNIFSIKTIYRSLNFIISNYELVQFIIRLQKLFDQTEGIYQIVFGSFLININSENINNILSSWIINEIDKILNTNEIITSNESFLLKIVATRLININHNGTIEFLLSYMNKNENHYEFIKNLFISTKHPLGKQIIYDHINSLINSNKINDIFGPMAFAITNYKTDCIEILKFTAVP